MHEFDEVVISCPWFQLQVPPECSYRQVPALQEDTAIDLFIPQASQETEGPPG